MSVDPGGSAGAPTVAVVGGGIAGLSAAWELVHAGGPGPRVIVLEGGSRFGGKLRTEPFGGREVDLGPDAFVARRPEAVTLCDELGLGDDLIAPGAQGASVWARGRLRPLPAGLALGVPTRFGPLLRSGICSPAGLVRPALDLLRPAFGSGPPSAPGGDRAVGAITRRRLGRQVTTRLAGPLIGGIHAGSVDTMSAAAVFPALLEADARPGSLMRALRPTPPPAAAPAEGAVPVFLTLPGGLSRLVETLTVALRGRGVELRSDRAVHDLRRGTVEGGPRWLLASDGGTIEADAVVLATPTPVAASLLRPHDGVLADALAGVTYSSVALITLRFDEAVVAGPLDGSGFLVPRGHRRRPDPLVTACTWLSFKWPELARRGDLLLRASVGRIGDRRHDCLDDDELVRRCVAELGPMMGLRGSPLEALVTRWPEAFPQYEVGHLTRVASMEAAAARLPSLALAGAALHGVGIPACIGSGRRAARAVAGAVEASSSRPR